MKDATFHEKVTISNNGAIPLDTELDTDVSGDFLITPDGGHVIVTGTVRASLLEGPLLSSLVTLRAPTDGSTATLSVADGGDMTIVTIPVAPAAQGTLSINITEDSDRTDLSLGALRIAGGFVSAKKIQSGDALTVHHYGVLGERFTTSVGASGVTTQTAEGAAPELDLAATTPMKILNVTDSDPTDDTVAGALNVAGGMVCRHRLQVEHDLGVHCHTTPNADYFTVNVAAPGTTTLTSTGATPELDVAATTPVKILNVVDSDPTDDSVAGALNVAGGIVCRHRLQVEHDLGVHCHATPNVDYFTVNVAAPGTTTLTSIGGAAPIIQTGIGDIVSIPNITDSDPTDITKGALLVTGGLSTGRKIQAGDNLSVHNNGHPNNRFTVAVADTGITTITTLGDPGTPEIDFAANAPIKILNVTDSSPTVLTQGALLVSGGIVCGSKMQVKDELTIHHNDTNTDRLTVSVAAGGVSTLTAVGSAGAVQVHISALNQFHVNNVGDSSPLDLSEGALCVSGGIASVGKIQSGGALTVHNPALPLDNMFTIAISEVGIATHATLTATAEGGNTAQIDVASNAPVYILNNADADGAPAALNITGGINSGLGIILNNGNKLSRYIETYIEEYWGAVNSPFPSDIMHDPKYKIYITRIGRLLTLTMEAFPATQRTAPGDYTNPMVYQLSLAIPWRPITGIHSYQFQVKGGAPDVVEPVDFQVSNTTGVIQIANAVWSTATFYSFGGYSVSYCTPDQSI